MLSLLVGLEEWGHWDSSPNKFQVVLWLWLPYYDYSAEIIRPNLGRNNMDGLYRLGIVVIKADVFCW